MGNPSNAGHIWACRQMLFTGLIGSFWNWDGILRSLSFTECLIKPVHDLPEMILIDKFDCFAYLTSYLCESSQEIKEVMH
jgi:hypothetical protein